LVALVATADWVVGASAGDCAAVLVTAGSTVDLTSRQRKHPAAGSRRAQFEPFASALIAPWRLLVVTDGVWKPIGWDELAAIVVRTPTLAIVDTLRGAAARRSGGSLMDDFSGALLER
jgi:hypothetical protein